MVKASSIQKAARRQGRLNAGDDLGHLAADEHGVDPEGVNRGAVTSRTRVGAVHRPNYTSQGARTNEVAGWRTEESRVTEHSKAAPVDCRVESTATEKRGLHHEQSWTMTATQTVDGRTTTVSDPKLVHGGFEDRLTANRRAEQAAAMKEAKAPAGDVEAQRAKVQRQSDAQKAKPAPAPAPTAEPSPAQQREKVAARTQAKSAPQPATKKSV